MQERVFLKQIVQKQPETETLDLAPQLYYYWIDKDTRAFKSKICFGLDQFQISIQEVIWDLSEWCSLTPDKFTIQLSFEPNGNPNWFLALLLNFDIVCYCIIEYRVVYITRLHQRALLIIRPMQIWPEKCNKMYLSRVLHIIRQINMEGTGICRSFWMERCSNFRSLSMWFYL